MVSLSVDLLSCLRGFAHCVGRGFYVALRRGYRGMAKEPLHSYKVTVSLVGTGTESVTKLVQGVVIW